MSSEIIAATRAPDTMITLTRNELEEMVSEIAEDAAEKAVRKVLKEIGIATHTEEAQAETAEDVRFMRLLRKAYTRAVVTSGTAVIMSVTAAFILLFWAAVKLGLKAP